ncbi:iron-containing alcohol dehydrogenase family protein [Enterococcus alishanensis]|uniref:Iron-containing alcohol dehydrogenase family protein n=1 Tax=Enterococcus alishanensis TaxID=1303817 RepID=A0ABS6TBW5_9ENTE|nr:iron-containing alcohol dehydrogenase family protein [Enterococcus alishanensis]MBV7390406.1 iron-containing alcohol dehydrogenase family protein [Enterococcus alishanensis]
MNIANEVRPGANRYVSGQNILEELPEYLASFEKIAVITGKKSYEVFTSYYKEELPYPIYRYDETASREDAQRLADEIGQVDVILAIGGGRLLDAAKMTAEVLNVEYILIPTLISNCAPFTPIVAVYHPDRTFRSIGYITRAPFLSLVDWDFLLEVTPVDYFIAGIGDTLAKWYEIDGITRRLSEDKKSAYVRLGIAAAKAILDILLQDSVAAIDDLKNKRLSPAFGRITDCIIALAGETGGFAATYGRSAGAHAVHDGLSYIEATHNQLHGKKVAYGILVQLAHTQEHDEIQKLIPFYQATGLPLKLAALNVADTSQESLIKVVNHAASANETFNMVDPDVTAEDVFAAIQVIESL